MKNNVDNFLNSLKFDELLRKKETKEDESKKKTILISLAIVGSVALVALIAYAVYRHMTPDYLDDFDDDFDDFSSFEDFEDDDILDTEESADISE